jgi:hypothetical protein
MTASKALMVANPNVSLVTKIRESFAARPDERWVAEGLATVGRLRAERTIDLDHVLFAAQGGFTFVLFDGKGQLPLTAAVLTVNRSHAITVKVERRHIRAEGVLVSCNNHGGGFVLYIKNNRLGYEYNCAGAVYTIRSDREVPVGASTLQFVFTKTGHLQGTGALYVNDEQVGNVCIPHTLPYLCPNDEARVQSGWSPAECGSERQEFPIFGMIKEVEISSDDGAPAAVQGIGMHALTTD